MQVSPMEASANTKPTSGAERRRAIRFQVGPGSSYRLKATLAEPLEPVAIRNISTTGIGLAVERWFEPGTVLKLELLNSARRSFCRVAVRVIYMVEDRSGEWKILGGAFEKPMREEELSALLG